MSEPTARKEFPLKQIGAAIANLYSRLQPKRSAAPAALPATLAQDEDKTQPLSPQNTVIALDDLPITNTITRRWPLAKLDYPAFMRAEEPSTMPPLLQTPLITPLPPSRSTARTPIDNDSSSSLADDETEEMDAIPGDESADV